MRFGAMFSGQVAERMGTLHWFPKKRLLELRLARGSEALFGEVAEARFRSLVQALGATSRVRLPWISCARSST